MRSSIGIDIAAPPWLVFSLARDVRRWPDVLPHYVDVRPDAVRQDGILTARMVARRPLVAALGLGMPVAWRATSWSEQDALRLRFHHLGGATNGMDVTWRIESSADGCRVTIDHTFSPRIEAWAWVIDRLFTRPIASLTLAAFKSIAEAVSSAQSATGTAAYPVR